MLKEFESLKLLKAAYDYFDFQIVTHSQKTIYFLYFIDNNLINQYDFCIKHNRKSYKEFQIQLQNVLDQQYIYKAIANELGLTEILIDKNREAINER